MQIVEMNYHHNNLLLDMSVRHGMTMMDMEDGKLSQQLQRFVKLSVINFFILAR